MPVFPKIAYLFSRYPISSQTFCDSEMLALEAAGVPLCIGSLNRGGGKCLNRCRGSDRSAIIQKRHRDEIVAEYEATDAYQRKNALKASCWSPGAQVHRLVTQCLLHHFSPPP